MSWLQRAFQWWCKPRNVAGANPRNLAHMLVAMQGSSELCYTVFCQLYFQGFLCSCIPVVKQAYSMLFRVILYFTRPEGPQWPFWLAWACHLLLWNGYGSHTYTAILSDKILPCWSPALRLHSNLCEFMRLWLFMISYVSTLWLPTLPP